MDPATCQTQVRQHVFDDSEFIACMYEGSAGADQPLLPAWRATCLMYLHRGITGNDRNATERIDTSPCGLAHGDSPVMLNVRAAASDVGVILQSNPIATRI